MTTKKRVRRQHMRAVMIPDELWEDAKTYAEGEGLSRSELVRRGLMREIALGRTRAMRRAMKEAGR